MVERTPQLAVSQMSAWSAQDENLLAGVLRAPWRYIKRRGHGWDEQLNRYEPPVTVYLLRGETSGETRTFIAISEAMQATPFAPFPAMRMNEFVLEVLRAKQLLDVGMGLRKPLATCPHGHCLFHSKGLCEGWLPIPGSAEECEFPGWLAANAGRTVSPDGATLVEIDRTTDVRPDHPG